MIGIFFMAVVFIPLLLLLVAFLFDKPRDFRVPALFMISVLGLTVMFIGIFALFGVILGRIVP